MKWYLDFADPLICVLWSAPFLTVATMIFSMLKAEKIIRCSWWWILLLAIPAGALDLSALAFLFIVYQMGKM